MNEFFQYSQKFQYVLSYIQRTSALWWVRMPTLRRLVETPAKLAYSTFLRCVLLENIAFLLVISSFFVILRLDEYLYLPVLQESLLYFVVIEQALRKTKNKKVG